MVIPFGEKKGPVISIVDNLAQFSLFTTIAKMLLGPPEGILHGGNDA